MGDKRQPKELIRNQALKEQREQNPDSLNLQENPTPPAEKTEEWKQFFYRVIHICRELGTDSWTDLDSVYEFCDVHCEVQELRRSVTQPDGSIQIENINPTNGTASIHPNYRALMTTRGHYHKLLDTFGMTPRGRAYLIDQRKLPGNKLANILGTTIDELAK